ncbi:Ig-like domain-containing protein [Arthrobacter antibioticus]|uniref:Ig-like domain-containing protein n=1 Tax=Arthrobacter sp. H35-MC1 TaxID=3046203 RepID=UPI0024BAE4FC|nr:Ig-like domain-containing protein [Arthrobacter sp. H35-MC1]MDJ0317097.1 Ig-like domain-containing protein [Arthrobacter sp. H35-MC1]
MALNVFAGKITQRRFFSVSAAAVVSAAVVAGALIYPGFSTADVDLNDGSVWVTNRSINMVGHLNVPSKVLDGGFTATSDGFDVLQDAGTVFMDNDSGTLLNQVDVPAMTLTQDTALGASKTISLGSEITVITDPASGKVWSVPTNTAGSFDEKTTKPIRTKITNARAAVALKTDDGVSQVFVLDPRAAVLTELKVSGDGKVIEATDATMEGLPENGRLTLSVVGDKPVVLDPETGTVFLPGNKKVVVPSAKGAKLQQRSEKSDFVALETGNSLVLQPLGGGTATIIDAGSLGTPIAPVQQGGCVHSAWNGSNKYLFHCVDGESKPRDIPKATAASDLVFRKNRDVVVLNDMAGGDVWLVNENMMLVNNWDDLSVDQKNAEDSDKDSADPNVVNTLPDRTKPNRPPVAEPDQYGVRAGSTTLLPVLYNDSDPDGDVLTVRDSAENIKAGSLQTVYGGTGLQLVTPADAPAVTETFSYTNDDGRGGTDQGTVSVRVVPEAENSEPVSMRPTTMIVGQGQTISQNVLADMLDPDGDSIFLVGASSAEETGQVKFTPDGELSYTDDGSSNGLRTVTIKVSDTRSIVEKKIKVSVKPSGGVPPVANADYVRVVVGQSAIVAPLANDQDPLGGELRLASVDKPESGTLSAIADNGTFTFSSETLGASYLTYQVTNGPQSATGLIRVDVVAAQKDLAPIAVKDMALLPVGGSTLVDVLGNDTDPAGGVLVVRGVDVSADAGVSVTVLEHNILKITDIRDPGFPVTINYTVSNGQGTSTGAVAVVRIPSPATLQPPVAHDDVADVRVGDVVRIPVLANDFDPNGATLKHPEIVDQPDEAAGKLWVDQDSLRFLAGPTPGAVSVIYQVTNASGQTDSATVTINIVAQDVERNLPPAPKNVKGRVIAGGQTKIQIPLDGIDPDGDSVQLAGIDIAPTLGTAVAGKGFVLYTAAGNAAGTDKFTYKVRDRLGAEAIGTVEVGIAPEDSSNRPPAAADDFISMRPDRKVALDVVLNDTDPDADQLFVIKDGFNGPDEMEPSVTDLGRVLLTSPSATGIATMGYTVSDPSGARATANIRMNVTPDAPLRAPIARDDEVTIQEALGKNTVTVPVLKNDEDPDGVADELALTLTLPNENASINSDGTLRITLSAKPQMIPYTVTDQDKLSSSAIVWVPGLDAQYPVLASNEVIKVQAGETAVANLGDYVKVREGRTPRISQADKIQMIGAPAREALTADGAALTYKADLAFYGPGSITFEVTDGTGPEDPDGLKSTLTIMTEVTPAPAKNLPPKLQGTELTVAQLESGTVNLGLLASDPEKDQLKFAITGDSPAGLKTKLDGASLTVEAAKEAGLGSAHSVGISVEDGHNPPVTAEVNIKVSSSTKPKAVANADSVPDAHAGRMETIPVLENDVNPFPDTALKIVDAKMVTGAPSTQVSVAGSNVTVQAPEDFTGNVVVLYTVADKTEDPARHVDGRITLNVKGKPAVPAVPLVQEVKSKSVLLKWSTPVDNGSPLTGYTVKRSDGLTQSCATNTCLITGLTNSKPYTFTVSAKNAVGESAFSKASASATPDQQPDKPAPPAIVRGDTTLDVSWVTPVGEYSAVKSFNVQISPVPAGQNPQKSVTGNKLVWPGLTNGTEYTFRVQAINSAPKPSEWSAYTAKAVSPAGKPFAPAPPTTSLVDQVGNQNQVRVNWSAPKLNGGVLKQYTLFTYLDGAQKDAITTTQTSQTVSLPNAVANYTFKVQATTEVSGSELSPASAGWRSVSQPGQVGQPTIALANTGGSGGQVTLTFPALSGAALGGATPGEITYFANVSPGANNIPVTSGQTISATNGANTTVTVRAKSAVFASSGSASAPSNSVKPYGTPGTAGLSGSNGGADSTSVSYSWSFPGGAVDAKHVEILLPSGGWSSKNGNGSASFNTGGYDTQVTIQARTVNSIGQYGPVQTVTPKSGKKTPPKPTSWTLSVNPRSCLEKASGNGDHFTPGSPANCSSQWLEANTPVQVNCYKYWGGRNDSHKWYHITSPGYSDWGYVKAESTNIPTPGGMGEC